MIPFIPMILTIVFPCILLWKSKKRRAQSAKHPHWFAAASFACGAWAIICELTAIRARLAAGDIAGIEDTMDGVILLSIAIAAVTVIANLIALRAACEQKEK